MKTTVRHILEGKGGEVWWVAPDAPVFAALEAMAQHNIGALLVMNGQQVIGIFSERDYARKVALEGKSSREIPVSEIMTGEVVTISPATTIQNCMALMTENRIRHLPVVEGGDLVGIISIGDVVKAMISDQQFMIEQLETYIAGGKG